MLQAVVDGHRQLVNAHYEAPLIGASRSKEIILTDLKPRDTKHFDDAMEKEWSKWQLYRAVLPLEEHWVAALGPNIKTIATWWVHVDNNERLQEGSNTGQPILAKSCLAVQGCQDKIDIESYNPTATLRAFNSRAPLQP